MYLDGEDAAARGDMCLASLFGGLALANAKLGAVHGFAGPLGGTYHAAYGIEEKDFADIVVKARTASSMKGNPIELTKEELLETLHKAL